MNKIVKEIVDMVMAYIFLAVLAYGVLKCIFIACVHRHETFWERAHSRNMWPKD